MIRIPGAFQKEKQLVLQVVCSSRASMSNCENCLRRMPVQAASGVNDARSRIQRQDDNSLLKSGGQAPCVDKCDGDWGILRSPSPLFQQAAKVQSRKGNGESQTPFLPPWLTAKSKAFCHRCTRIFKDKMHSEIFGNCFPEKTLLRRFGNGTEP